jgi:hypothetical protein
LLGDFRIRTLLQPELHDAALLIVRAGQKMLKLVGKCHGFGGRRFARRNPLAATAADGQGPLTLGRSLLPAMEAGLLPRLGYGDRTQQPPQGFSIGQFKLAGPCPAEKRATDRLHDVVRAFPSVQP